MAGPVWRRRAARVVLLDREGRVLLLNAIDPADASKPNWWELPGGGINPGEDSADTAVRELYEETGLENTEMGPCVWTRHTQFEFGGFSFDQHERIHIAWCDGGDVHPKGLELLEMDSFQGWKWWELDDLLASDVPTWPSRIRDYLPDLVKGNLPPEPVDVGD